MGRILHHRRSREDAQNAADYQVKYLLKPLLFENITVNITKTIYVSITFFWRKSFKRVKNLDLLYFTSTFFNWSFSCREIIVYGQRYNTMKHHIFFLKTKLPHRDEAA